MPGCILALISRGEIIAVQCFGVADATSAAPVNAQTRFSLQSVSKSYDAWTVMALAEAGRLDLDAPASRYLTRWRSPASDKFNLDFLTARRLPSHHAGVTVTGFRGVELNPTGYDLLDAMQRRLPPPTEAPLRLMEPAAGRQPRHLDTTARCGLALFERRLRTSGSGIRGYNGLKDGEYVTWEVLGPLGLEELSFGRRDDLPFATPHDREGLPTADYRQL